MKSKRFHVLTTATVLTAASLTLVMCRAPETTGSSTKSLDNFAKAGSGQSETINSCGIDYDGKQTLPPQVQGVLDRIHVDASYESSRRAVIGALVAVPKSLAAPFFLSGGTIEVRPDAGTICHQTPFSAAERQIADTAADVPACWQQPQAGKAPHIFVTPDPAVIRHSMVRLFGYFYTEYFVARILAPAAPAPFNAVSWKTAAQSFNTTRGQLADAFLSDLQTKNHDAYTRLAKFRSSDATHFDNYVFAEALDSYYCSKDTRSKFQSMFQKAWNVFTDQKVKSSPVSEFGI